MNPDFVTRKQAERLEKLKLEVEEFHGWYRGDTLHNYYVAPNAVPALLYQQAFALFRKHHNLWVEVKVQDNVRLGEQKFYWLIFGEYKSAEGNGWIRAIADSNDIYYDEYEQAETACLDKLLEIVEGRTA